MSKLSNIQKIKIFNYKDHFLVRWISDPGSPRLYFQDLNNFFHFPKYYTLRSIGSVSIIQSHSNKGCKVQA